MSRPSSTTLVFELRRTAMLVRGKREIHSRAFARLGAALLITGISALALRPVTADGSESSPSAKQRGANVRINQPNALNDEVIEFLRNVDKLWNADSVQELVDSRHWLLADAKWARITGWLGSPQPSVKLQTNDQENLARKLDLTRYTSISLRSGDILGVDIQLPTASHHHLGMSAELPFRRPESKYSHLCVTAQHLREFWGAERVAAGVPPFVHGVLESDLSAPHQWNLFINPPSGFGKRSSLGFHFYQERCARLVSVTRRD